MMDLKRVLEGEIRALERIVAADESVLELEKVPAKRDLLRGEIRKVLDRIDRLKGRIDDLSGID
jgi:hypothetical protein